MNKNGNYIFVLIDVNTGKQFFNDLLMDKVYKNFTPKIENKIHKVYCERFRFDDINKFDTFEILYINTPGRSRVFVNKCYKLSKMGDSNYALIEIDKETYRERYDSFVDDLRLTESGDFYGL